MVYGKAINMKKRIMQLKSKCECGNPNLGFDCTCEWVKNYPGDNNYSCEYCGIYQSSKPRCNKCEKE